MLFEPCHEGFVSQMVHPNVELLDVSEFVPTLMFALICLDSLVLRGKGIFPDILLKEAYNIGLGLFLCQRIFWLISMQNITIDIVIYTVVPVSKVFFLGCRV